MSSFLLLFLCLLLFLIRLLQFFLTNNQALLLSRQLYANIGSEQDTERSEKKKTFLTSWAHIAIKKWFVVVQRLLLFLCDAAWIHIHSVISVGNGWRAGKGRRERVCVHGTWNCSFRRLIQCKFCVRSSKALISCCHRVSCWRMLRNQDKLISWNGALCMYASVCANILINKNKSYMHFHVAGECENWRYLGKVQNVCTSIWRTFNTCNVRVCGSQRSTYPSQM